MDENITYLFGAGASAKALPVVDEIPKRLDQLIVFLEDEKYSLGNTWFDKEKDLVHPSVAKNIGKMRECQLEMIRDLKNLRIKMGNHLSVDTLAKKYYLS